MYVGTLNLIIWIFLNRSFNTIMHKIFTYASWWNFSLNDNCTKITFLRRFKLYQNIFSLFYWRQLKWFELLNFLFRIKFTFNEIRMPSFIFFDYLIDNHQIISGQTFNGLKMFFRNFENFPFLRKALESARIFSWIFIEHIFFPHYSSNLMCE